MVAFWIIVSAIANAQTTHTVELQAIAFNPPDLNVRVGDTVHWVWITGFHNVESGTVDASVGVPDGRFRSGNPTPTPGTTFDLRFDDAFLAANPAPGRAYPFYCIVHAGAGMAGTVSVVDCLADADCSPDQSPCTDDRCVAGVCQHPLNTASCDDGNACTTGDACDNGVCGGAPLNCDDGKLCTTDSCVGGACQNINNTNSCNDDNPCTADDRCSNGTCGGTSMNCDDGVACSVDSCGNGICQHDRSGCDCDDDSDCNDEKECTDDRCDVGRCAHTNSALSCDDQDPCTNNDHCTNGSCLGTPNDECCVADKDCPAVPCEDVHCENRGCIRAAVAGCTPCEAATDCDDEDPCTDDTCAGGVCENPFNEAPCDDDDRCTRNDRCAEGLCAGTPIDACCPTDADCEDDDVCTEDRCVDARCIHVTIPTCEQAHPGDDHADPVEEPPTLADEPSTLIDEPPGRSAPRSQPGLCGALGVIPVTLFAWLMSLPFLRLLPGQLGRNRNRGRRRELRVDNSKGVEWDGSRGRRVKNFTTKGVP